MLQWLRGVVVAVTWLDGGRGRWWLWWSWSCHGGGGSCAMLCCGGCVVWRSWLWSHGLMMAVAGGGSGGGSRIMEVAAIVSRCVVVAA
jgi:hypothetical protein